MQGQQTVHITGQAKMFIQIQSRKVNPHSNISAKAKGQVDMINTGSKPEYLKNTMKRLGQA